MTVHVVDASLSNMARTYQPAPELAGPPSETTIFNTTKQITQTIWKSSLLKPNEKRADDFGIVIFINAASTDHCTRTTLDTEAGYGLYFGPESKYNISARLPFKTMQTNQAAEIYAAIQAVTFVRENLGEEILKIILVTSCKYLANAMQRLIFTWYGNGWVASNGTPVENKDAFVALDQLIEAAEEDGVLVEFWYVPLDQNADARALASHALDMEDV